MGYPMKNLFPLLSLRREAILAVLRVESPLSLIPLTPLREVVILEMRAAALQAERITLQAVIQRAVMRAALEMSKIPLLPLRILRAVIPLQRAAQVIQIPLPLVTLSKAALEAVPTVAKPITALQITQITQITVPQITAPLLLPIAQIIALQTTAKVQAPQR